MKILISARGFDTRHGHEIGIFELDQAKALRDFGHEVRIAAIDTRSIRRRRPWGLRRYELEGIPVIYAAVPAGALPGKLYAAAERYAIRLLRQELEKSGWTPDVLHAHFGGGLLSYAEEEHIPFVYTEHFSGANRPEVSDAELRREKNLYSRSARLLCVSTALAENIFRHTGIRAAVIPNIVDTGSFSPSPRAHDGFRFVTACNLTEGKNIASLLRALSSVPVASLTVFGDGPARGSLEKTAEERGIAERVVFRGQCSRTELNEAYASSDCFVLPSRSETFGVAYIEAMAAGLPVIAARCGGPEDFVTENNGLLVPPDDDAALAEAMKDMMTRHSEFDGALIAAEARRRFSPERIAGLLTEQYGELVQKNASLR